MESITHNSRVNQHDSAGLDWHTTCQLKQCLNKQGQAAGTSMLALPTLVMWVHNNQTVYVCTHLSDIKKFDSIIEKCVSFKWL